MDKLVYILIAVVVLFILTYNPKSGTLNKFLHEKEAPKKKQCCDDEQCRAQNPSQCKYMRYGALQFDQPPPGFENTRGPATSMGAIIGP
jgi:uncharacterized protein YxeA